MTFSLWHIGSNEASVSHKKSRVNLDLPYTIAEPKFMIKFDVY